MKRLRRENQFVPQLPNQHQEMAKKQILYIVNPKSGIGKKSIIESDIRDNTDRMNIEYDIIHTTHRGHAHEIATRNRNKIDMVIAVGGDGTVNEVGSALLGSKTAMGIIPCGSGNGLARALDIPLRTSTAIEVINDFNTKKIDVINIGGHTSLNVAGVGFDAYISHLFAKKRIRGPLQYMNLIATEYPKYKPQEWTLNIDGDIYNRTAFLISFANSSQWGNNIHIAPNAQVDDGQMDVCIVSEFPHTAVPSLVISLLSQSIDSNKYDEMIRTRHLELSSSEPIVAHIDGEPISLPNKIEIELQPKALTVAAPSAEFFDSHRFNPAKVREQIINSVREPINEIKQALKEL